MRTIFCLIHFCDKFGAVLPMRIGFEKFTSTCLNYACVCVFSSVKELNFHLGFVFETLVALHRFLFLNFILFLCVYVNFCYISGKEMNLCFVWLLRKCGEMKSLNYRIFF